MAQKVTINIRQAKQSLSSLRARIQKAIPKALSRTGEKAKEIIINRTSKGQGLNGAFKKYSPDYIDFRKKKGRGTKPDLNFSGRMLSNMDVRRVSTNKVLVTFKRNEEKKKAQINQKTRPFMGIKTGEVSQLEIAFLKQFKRYV